MNDNTMQYLTSKGKISLQLGVGSRIQRFTPAASLTDGDMLRVSMSSLYDFEVLCDLGGFVSLDDSADLPGL
jgi:hypothetical protein